MGHYTEIYISVNLKDETPDDVIAVLKAICDKDYKSEPLKNYPSRWGLLFNSGSSYTPDTECGTLSARGVPKQISLIGKGDIKNYNNEIELFFEWIMPWVDASVGEFIGYYRYEQWPLPTLVLKPDPLKDESKFITHDEIRRGVRNARGLSDE